MRTFTFLVGVELLLLLLLIIGPHQMGLGAAALGQTLGAVAHAYLAP